ncbi:anaphase-promoting complex subunit 1 [Histomonas meleagridis]|uniref:anaphase-promoting complex subunit 1 n=1 Tax=Histomonas meleagridis TaxID=135588 RepID=UPI00355A20AD|nr:anaphase-promoting complex subunit 1 [Histomonas meleagridis]KAH0798655.1 anaphase-promoting complex subunit 1 [Histomonas meleagridis]
MIRNVGPFKPFGVDKLPKSTKSYKVKLHNDGDELCWSENEIIWSKFRCLLHQLTLPGEIIDATICTIDKERYLAVLYQTGLTLFSYSGESFLIPLPFQIAKIFPLHKSLLLFRSPNSSLIHSQYSDFPVLFTLFHVLEEIRPVAFSTPNISTPLPKYTTIQTPKTFGDSFADFEKDLSYITDLGFVPLQVSDQRGYLLSYANDSISIWKLRDANRSRDLLFSSPHYIRSPSIFSPPAIKPYLYSPTTDARIEIKSTLEGIPPDLYMEMIYEFNQSEPTNCSFIDISDGNKKILLFLHNHKLIGLDISYNNSDKILFTIEEVEKDISTLYKYIENEKVKNIIDFSQPDLRFLEVERLLQSHIPLTIDVERPNGTDDIQFQAMLIEKLGILLGKQWSLSIGRGLFNFNTFEPLSSQVLKFDTLNNCGFTDNAIELKPDEEFLKQEKLEWPQFHNGVSSSLTIINADNSWILDTITKEINPQTAGALFGFGITGLLKKVWKSELYNYLNSNELKDINIIATLLGLGISYRSTRDILISNMITQYIPELHQFNDDDEEISPLIQSSAIVGIGFLFESSCNRHFTEIFMNMLQESSLMEIPTQPLSLGISIGLINLGKGDKSSVLRDNREKLCEIFCGNKSLDAESEKIITFGNSDFFSIAPSSMFSLILGYLRTDSEHVKKALSLPEDSTYINTLVPDIVLMRTMGSLLIDSKPESALNFCVPKGLEPEILTAMVTGFSIACGVKYAGTLNIKAFERIMTIAKCLSLLEKEPFDFKDCNVLYREQCLSIVLVSCSLIIAGTCEVDFLRFVRFIRRRPISTTLTQYNFGFHMMLSMAIGILNLGKGRYTIGRNNSQTAAILIALYPRISRFIEDNDFYLQPLRHLISIAAVPRVLEVRDVFTQEILHVMAHVILKDGTEVIMNTPHVLPPFELIKSIVIDDNKYYKINFEQLENEDKRPIIWVKKLSDEHVKEKLDVENLRMVLKMKENSLLSTKNETNNEYEIQKCKVEIDCDEIGNKIMEFLRSDSVKERINMLKDHKLKNFLLFYAIDPSAKISDVRKFDDDAISFLMPFMNEKEILALENSNI